MKPVAFIFTMMLSALAIAQPGDLKHKKEKLDAMRVAFITEELELTPEEAQVFWPVYNERQKKVDDLRHGFMKQMMDLKKSGKTIDDLSDKEVEELMQTRISNELAIAKINEEYHDKLVAVIGIKKTAKLYMAEMQFQRKLLEHHRGGRHGEGRNDKGQRRN